MSHRSVIRRRAN